MTQDTEREAFEAWVLTQGLPGKLESVWAWEAWQARAALASQQAGKGEPAAAQHRFRRPQKGTPYWSDWQQCKVSSRPPWEIDSAGYEVEYRNLYASPPSREPLTEPELRHVLDGTNNMVRNAMRGPFWPELEEACRAIERAHGIHSREGGSNGE